MVKNLLVGQSGGPTAVINASLAGVIDYALNSGAVDTIYGMINGIEGLFEENIMNLSEVFGKKRHRINRLKFTPAMYLGSCRFKLSNSDEEFEKIVKILKKYQIAYFVYIGGNDSMDTVKKLSDYVKKQNLDIKVVGVPKTIDNDLNGIDHSPGFGSAARFVATAVKNIAYDTSIYSIKSVHIIEAMGRNAGWLAASSVLARDGNVSAAPHLIYLPELVFDIDKFVNDIKEKLETMNTVIVVVSEGVRDKEGNFIGAKSANSDQFGHNILSGAAAYLKTVVESRVGCKVRALELSVLQRSFGNLSALTDVNEAFNLGMVAVKSALKGETGVFATLRRTSDVPYEITYGTEDVSVIANTEKFVPREWINEAGNDVTDEMISYLKPLTVGVAQMLYKNGLPDYIDISHLDSRQQKYNNS